MKKLLALILTLSMIFALTACGTQSNEPTSDNHGTSAPTVSDNTDESKENPTDTPNTDHSDEESNTPDHTDGSKILVAYFSATNNTEGVAQKLANGLGADLYEIVPEQPYTDEDLDYGNSKSRSSVEMNDPNARPAISGSVENMEQYDIVFIGYPIWWGEAPRIMNTFVESYDFSGKTLVAFCTSGGSGFGSSDKALKSATGKATWLEGRRFSTGVSAEDLLTWANGLGIN